MAIWGWQRASDCPDSHAGTCFHEWVLSPLVIPLELRDVVDEWAQFGLKAPIEHEPHPVGMTCKRCGHMKLGRF